jgi:hypothetical protein
MRKLLGFGFCLRSGFGLLGVGCGELAAEAVDATGCVYELLLSGEEGVAGGADFDDDRTFVGGARVELITAGALDVRVFVLGVNSCLRHVCVSFQLSRRRMVSLAGPFRKMH